MPAIIYVANPYAKDESGPPPSSIQSRLMKEIPSSTCMPSEEWRRSFLSRFANMRETLANRAKQHLSSYPEKIPRGRNGKKWYRFLHGRDLVEDVEYDEEQEEGSDAEGTEIKEAEAFKCRDPSEALLHHFGTVSRLATFLTMITRLNACSLYFYSLALSRCFLYYPTGSRNHTSCRRRVVIKL